MTTSINTAQRLALLLTILTLSFLWNSCEKALDNSIPADATTRAEENQRFTDMLPLADPEQVWISNMLPIQGNSFFTFQFHENKEADITIFLHDFPTLVDQLIAIYFKPGTTDEDKENIEFLVGAFGDFGDAELRDLLLNNPANIDFLELTELYAPVNYTIGTPSPIQDESPFSVDGYFDTNLTFGSQSILSQLKNFGEFDFDFQVTSFNQDSIQLYGAYYDKNANRNVTLKPYLRTDIALYNQASVLIAELQTLDVVTGLQVAGTDVILNNQSGAGYLFRNYRNGMNMSLPYLGFQPLQSAVNLSPELADVAFLRPVEVFSGDPESAPAGTVLIRFDAYQAGSLIPMGDKAVELVVGP